MAGTVVIVSSSPLSIRATSPRPQRETEATGIVTWSSSELPSPDALFTTRTCAATRPKQLKSGSRSAQIPEGAIKGFESTGKLLREKKLTLSEELGRTEKPCGNTNEAPSARSEAEMIPEEKGREDAECYSLVCEANMQGRDDSAVSAQRQRSCLEKDVSSVERSAMDQSMASRVAENAVSGHMSLESPNVEAHATKISLASQKLLPQESHNECTEISKQNEVVKTARSKASRSAKPRATKAKPKTKLKVTKAGSSRRRKKSSEVSAHFKECARIHKANKAIAEQAQAAQALELSSATGRRASWTPVKDSKGLGSPVSTLLLSAEDPLSPCPGLAPKLDLSNFAYSKSSTLSSVSPQKRRQAATIKRRIALVENPCQNTSSSKNMVESGMRPCSESPSKKGAKKPKTITELTIAQFRDAESSVERNDSTTVSGTVSSKGQPANRQEGNPQEGFKVPSKPPRPRKASKRTPKPVTPKPILLDADAFKERVESQDILFGTGSQLANESPTFVRHLQRAIQESAMEARQHCNELAQYETVPIWTSAERRNDAPPARSVDLGGGLISTRSGGKLYNALTGGIDDEVWVPTQKQPEQSRSPLANFDVCTDSVDGRVIHDPRGRGPGQENCERLAPKSVSAVNRQHRIETDSVDFLDVDPEDESFVNIDQIIGQETPPSGQVTLLSPITPAVIQIIDPVIAPSPSVPLGTLRQHGLNDIHGQAGSRPVLSPVKGNALLRKVVSPSSSQFTKAIIRTASTDARSSRDQTQHLDLNVRSKESGPQDAEVPQITASRTTKRPRGRPKKNAGTEHATLEPSSKRRRQRPTGASAKGGVSPERTFSRSSSSFINIEDIEDSEPEISPSPPRRKRQVAPHALELALCPAEPSAEPVPNGDRMPNFESQKEEIFVKITQKLRSATRSSNPSKPNWYEKILLYDPIVLEDLTEWLNDEGLKYRKPRLQDQKSKSKSKSQRTAVNDGGKAKASGAPMEDAHGSVLNERGQKGERGVASSDRPLQEMDELPLEPWMVQKWCEAHSICCLWREGLRGGVRARY